MADFENNCYLRRLSETPYGEHPHGAAVASVAAALFERLNMHYRKVKLPNGVEAFANDAGSVYPYTDKRSYFIAINSAAADAPRVPSYLDEVLDDESGGEGNYFFNVESRQSYKYRVLDSIAETSVKRRIALDWAIIEHEREMRHKAEQEFLNQEANNDTE